MRREAIRRAVRSGWLGRVGGLVSLASIAFGAASLAVVPEARASCRTMTCPLPADFQPSAAACVPPGFTEYCASLTPPVPNPIPVWWKNECVGYSVQKDASRQVPYDDAARLLATAFSKWTSAACPSGGAATSRVTIDMKDLGPVSCGEVAYNQASPNQHVIVFRDDAWPHNDASNTLALTTVVFNPDSGELYDADMEINTAQVKVTLADPVPSDGYDFASIVTHETGHFLGMAHSGDPHSTMFAHYQPGSTAMRGLTADDVHGICSIYAPDGTRAVDKSVVPSGAVAADACDPTPRHGFASECHAQAPSKGCSVAGAIARRDGVPLANGAWAFIAAAAVISAAARRRARALVRTL
jgi:hypothetical protein